jgi:phage I-like protein
VTQRFGYWTDLSTVQLSDEGPTWIQGMPLGEYKHPFFGDIKITPQRIKRFADNVNNKVRGTDLDIDYDHKMTSGEAAGWVTAADARADGLYLLVDWTPKARTAIRERAYRYFSPEFTDEWEHPKSKQKHQDVLFGGGITNRPFLKDIAPINASELVLGGQVTNTGGTGMDPKELRKLLGLSEGATDDQVTAKLTELMKPPAPPEPPKNDPPKLNEPNEDLKKLAEDNPTVKALIEAQESMRRQLAEQAKTLRLSEMTTKVTQLNEKATQKNVAFPAVVLNELPSVLVDMSDTSGAKVLELFEKLVDTKLVQLGEKGHQQNSGGGTNEEGQGGLHKAILALMDKNKDLTYAEAMDTVLHERPELFDNYRSSAYAGRE